MTVPNPMKLRPLAFKFPVLTETDVAASNALPPASAAVEFASGPIARMDFSLDARFAPRTIGEEIQIQLDGQPILVRLEESILEPLVRLGGYKVETASLARDPELGGLLLEHLLTATLVDLEGRKNRPIRIDRVRANPDLREPDFPLRVRFQLATDVWSKPCTGELIAPTTASAELLQSLLEPISSTRNAQPPEVHATARLLSQAFTVRRADLVDLAVGDGLVLDDDFDLRHDLRLAFSPRHFAVVEWDDAGLVVTGLCNRADPAAETTETVAMSDYDESIAIDEVPVALSLELDRIDITFAELAELRAGSVVPFRSTKPETVRVLANGRPLATAELVQIGEKLGVRIVALARSAE